MNTNKPSGASRLSKHALGQYVTEIINAATDTVNATVIDNPLLVTLKQKQQTYKECISKSPNKMISKQLKSKEKNRNNALRAFNLALQMHKYSPDTEKVEAATRLIKATSKLAPNALNSSPAASSAMLEGLIKEFSSGDYYNDIIELGITPQLDNLIREQQNFLKVVNERMEDRASKIHIPTASGYRAEVQKALRNFRLFVSAMALGNMNPVWKNLDRKLMAIDVAYAHLLKPQVKTKHEAAAVNDDEGAIKPYEFEQEQAVDTIQKFGM